MAHNLRPDLDQFLPQRCQRPVTHRSGHHRVPQEIAQVTRSACFLLAPIATHIIPMLAGMMELLKVVSVHFLSASSFAVLTHSTTFSGRLPKV
jgi:hypothetical protein